MARKQDIEAMKQAGPLMLGLCLCLLAGCQAAAIDPDRPAVLVNPDAQARSSLADAVSSMLGGRAVPLAPDALTKQDLLIVEPATHQSMQGNLGSGRQMVPPEKFHLVMRQGHCVLLHDASGTERWLTGAHCQPAP